MSLESCSKANASADVIGEENNLYASFLMTMSSKFFTSEVQYGIEYHNSSMSNKLLC